MSPAIPGHLGQTKLQAETILCEETGTGFWDRLYALSDPQTWTSAAQLTCNESNPLLVAPTHLEQADLAMLHCACALSTDYADHLWYQ